MADVTCPIDNEHVQEIVHGKTGHFKYVPNGESCHGSPTYARLSGGGDAPASALQLWRGTGPDHGGTVCRVDLDGAGENGETHCAPRSPQYGLYPKKGALLPGLSDADLVIWYPPGRLDEFSLTNEHLHHNTDCTR